jgi:tetratricopeptide (TPR) repeat protein
MPALFQTLAAAALLLLVSAAPAPAHDSPEHVIEILTARMETIGERPDLLWRRATEHRVLGNLPAAASDLKRAIKLQSDFSAAWVDLGRVRLAQGRHREARRTVGRLLASIPDEAGRAPIRMLQAEIFVASGDYAAALKECDRAIAAAGEAQLDWYLTRSQIQSGLGKFAEAADGLRRGFERTGSAVLEVECLDAMIDAGQHEAAAEKVDVELREVRWRGSWLLRRARIQLARGNISDAHRDLGEAILEFNRRINPTAPEPGLLVERGFASALLGDLPLARKDLVAARQVGADAPMLRRLELALRPSR